MWNYHDIIEILDYINKREKKIIPNIIGILSYFTCKKCTKCCSKCKIMLSDEEILKYLKIMGDSFFNLLDEYEIENCIKPPCNFLNNNYCKIYEIRPFVCTIYPFSLKDIRGITLCLCPMGLEIKNEFLKFLRDPYFNKNKISIKDQRDVEKIIKRDSSEIIEEYLISYDIIILFYKYLKSITH